MDQDIRYSACELQTQTQPVGMEANLPNALKPIGFTRNKSGSVKMHDAVFYTFTTMEDTGEYPR